MDRNEAELFGFDRPSFADELVGREALQGLEPPVEVVGADKVGEVSFELVVVVIVIASDGSVLDRAVHPLDLAVRPRVFRFGGAVIDISLGAGEFEGMGAERLSVRHRLLDERDRRAAGTRRREVDALRGLLAAPARGSDRWPPGHRLSVSTVWIL